MEQIKEPISVRVARLNAQFLGKTQLPNLIYKESTLDALLVLYDECNNDYLKKSDKNVSSFVSKYRNAINELRNMRVNVYDFEIKTAIGRGHFGDVYLVKEKQTGDIYALKSLKKSECLDVKSATFEEERNIMALTQSQWLTSLQYSFQDSTYLYLVMDYHPGGDLLGLLGRQGGTIPESAATFYVAEIVVALHDLHSMGYVHRDIKPDNILLDRFGHIKLADFGSAAKINSKGAVSDCLPIGTPDYIAPEVLQSSDNKFQNKSSYGHLCDYWSLGVVAYQLTTGVTPFTCNSTASLYSKIMNHVNSLKFPPDIVLSQAYVSLVKGLLTDQNARLDYEDIIKHPLFKNVDFSTLHDQVAPFIPKISATDDTSNFSDIPKRKSRPDIENFKNRTQFSGRNLPFIGFTFIKEAKDNEPKEKLLPNVVVKDERVQNLLKDVDSLQRKLNCQKDLQTEKENLEKKLGEKSRKLESVESVRDRLERDLANSITECSMLKRTLELERKNQAEVEHKALELIKSAKKKWENAEKTRIEALAVDLKQQKEKVDELTYANTMLRNQLEQALEMKDKQKESLEKVHSLNRCSIMGLESRLEMVTTECQNQVSDLQDKLSQEVHCKNLLENQLSVLKCSETELKNKLKVTEELCANLKSELKESQNVIKALECKILEAENSHKEEKNLLTNIIEKLQNQLQEKDDAKKLKLLEQEVKKEQKLSGKLQDEIADLKTTLATVKEDCEKKIKEMDLAHEKTVGDLQLQISQYIKEKEELEGELHKAHIHTEQNAIKVKTLEELLARLESGVLKLESETEKESVLKEQLERLEQQLVQTHEKAALEKEELAKLKTKYWRMEKDLNNAEIDKRILKRELKELEDRVKQFSDEITNMQAQTEQNKKAYESALLELNDLNENLATEVTKLQTTRCCLEESLKAEKDKYEKEKNFLDELKIKISEKEKETAIFLKKLEAKEGEKRETELKLERAVAEKSRILQQMEELKKDKVESENELEKCRRELQNTQKNSAVLREACTLLETQLIEYEKLQGTCKAKENSMNERIENLLKELAKSNEDVQEARKQANEEISLRLLAETKARSLKEDVECLEKECHSFKEQCIEFKNYSNTLVEELTAAEEKISELKTTTKTLEHRIDNMHSENKMLKEEGSQRLTHLNEARETNCRLMQQVAELKDENVALVDRIAELENLLVEKMNFYKERELKANATLQQQTKLIHFLQSKVEESKRKKTFTDKLFGHSRKENLPPAISYDGARDLGRQTKDMQRTKSHVGGKERNGFENVTNGEDASNLGVSKMAIEKLVQSPSKQTGDCSAQKVKERMHHNIPHRFELKVCTKALKCAQCLKKIILGHNFSVCQECEVAVHPTCISAIPHTCCLPNTYVKHYSDSLMKLDDVAKEDDNIPPTKGVQEVISLEGWVKTPNKTKSGWDKTYACLTSQALKIYAEPPNSKNATPVECLELRQPNTHAKVQVEPLPSEIDVPVANSDLQFIVKVEVSPDTTCWPPKSLAIMTLGHEEKEKWFKALQSAFQVKEYKYMGDTIVTWKEELDVNCLVELPSGDKLLGAEQGLYTCHRDFPTQIAGVTRVQQIAVLPGVHFALMIVDDEHHLISCDLNLLVSLAERDPFSKPQLPVRRVNTGRTGGGFHAFYCSDFVKRYLVCAATAKHLVIVRYDLRSRDFTPLKILDTAEPVSCALFTDHSLIVGADKFFEIDLQSFEAEEFVDATDRKLAQAAHCSRLGSFPVFVAELLHGKEYLLCFSHFAVFADNFGRASRRYELKWSRLPRDFYYQAPYLYVVQFAGVETYKIRKEDGEGESDEEEVESFRVEMKAPRYLGASKTGVYIGLEKEVRLLEAKQLDDCSSTGGWSTTTEKEDEEEETGSEFSFTSSMVRSLDGMCDEVDGDNEEWQRGRKRVKFPNNAAEL